MVRVDEPLKMLMDHDPPIVDGRKTTMRWKASTNSRDIPVITVLSHAQPEERRRAIAAGCDALNSKLFDMKAVYIRIEALADDRHNPDPER